MKSRIAILILLATLLSACNFTLAEDVTPPPGYIPPTPAPTLSLVPPQTPNTANGEAIFIEKCAPCHGETGMGDGPQGIQLGVTVPAFALSEVARPASPAEWYTIVTRGKIERFMPPFASLNDQQRWDVVTYIMSLHTSEEEIQKGREIFEATCADCSTDFFTDPAKMSALSTISLARIIRLGNEEVPAFGENLSDEEMWAVAEYLRSLTYNTAVPASPTLVPPTETPVSTNTLTPSAEDTSMSEGTPSADTLPVGTEQTIVPTEAATTIPEGFGTVHGSIDNKTGDELPTGLPVILHGYEHDFANPEAGTQEVLTLEGVIAPDGTFVFENVEMPENRIFLASVTYEDLEINSGFVIVEAGQNSVELPPIVLYAVTTDTSELIIDELTIFLGSKAEDTYEIVAMHTFRNQGEATIAVKMGEGQTEIPFIKFPEGAEPLGYEAVQDSAPFISTADGFAMPPSEQAYGLLAYSAMPTDKETSISQPVELPVTIARIMVPEGMKVESDQLTEGTTQDIQGVTYQTYEAGNLNAGDVLTFTASGTQKQETPAATDTATPESRNALLIGAAGLGLALILAGVWMFLRDRKRRDEGEDSDGNDDDEDEEEFESTDDVTDAIIALDDLHRAKKISDEAYQKRRAELKEILKEMM